MSHEPFGGFGCDKPLRPVIAPPGLCPACARIARAMLPAHGGDLLTGEQALARLAQCARRDACPSPASNRYRAQACDLLRKLKLGL